MSFDLIAFLKRVEAFSAKTFGPRNSGFHPAGHIDHIEKELAEIAADPRDLEEWIDVALLAFDGAWRAGYSADEIAAALAAKHAKNQKRKWPDWRTVEPGKAIEHIREEA